MQSGSGLSLRAEAGSKAPAGCLGDGEAEAFLRASAMLKHIIDIGRLSVCPSVTRRYCIKTAERIVMISSPHVSSFILVLCIPRSSRNSDGVTPAGALNTGGV